MTLLTVTHDRAFLQDVCNSILELDRGSFYSYDGSYSNYIQGKEERLANEDQQVHVAKQKYKKERECVTDCLNCWGCISVATLLTFTFSLLPSTSQQWNG